MRIEQICLQISAWIAWRETYRIRPLSTHLFSHWSIPFMRTLAGRGTADRPRGVETTRQWRHCLQLGPLPLQKRRGQWNGINYNPMLSLCDGTAVFLKKVPKFRHSTLHSNSPHRIKETSPKSSLLNQLGNRVGVVRMGQKSLPPPPTPPTHPD